MGFGCIRRDFDRLDEFYSDLEDIKSLRVKRFSFVEVSEGPFRMTRNNFFLDFSKIHVSDSKFNGDFISGSILVDMCLFRLLEAFLSRVV